MSTQGNWHFIKKATLTSCPPEVTDISLWQLKSATSAFFEKCQLKLVNWHLFLLTDHALISLQFDISLFELPFYRKQVMLVAVAYFWTVKMVWEFSMLKKEIHLLHLANWWLLIKNMCCSIYVFLLAIWGIYIWILDTFVKGLSKLVQLFTETYQIYWNVPKHILTCLDLPVTWHKLTNIFIETYRKFQKFAKTYQKLTKVLLIHREIYGN